MKKVFILFAVFVFFTLASGCGEVMKKEVTQGTGYKNNKIAWGFKKIKGEPPEIPQQWAELLRRYDGHYIGSKDEKKLYLTFDEGYENGHTSKILDILKETNTPAAFFITGAYIKREKELVLRMAQEGHVVGNHTENHPSMPEVLSDEKLLAEITKLNDTFFALAGKNMKYLRPPKGEFSERTLAVTQKAGYKTILWSSAYVDWLPNKASGNTIKQVTEYFHNGSVILLHAVSRENAQALPEIISIAREQGFTFASLDDLQ